MEKICICCKLSKPIEDFYSHPGMKDGRLNKCRSCCKTQAESRYNVLIKDTNFAESERERNRKKYHKYKYKPSALTSANGQRSYRSKYPEKDKAKQAARRAGEIKPGFHRHHWSYLKEHRLDTIELHGTNHIQIHRYLVYDPTEMKYRVKGCNELLDSREKHIKFIERILSNK